MRTATGGDTVTEDRMTFLEALRKADGTGEDFLRDGVRQLVREVMAEEVTALVGAEPYERSADRTAQRNGYRRREWDTRLGTIELEIPKLRTGSYYPSFLEPRKRSEQALVSVVAEAYLQGVSTRKVEDLVQSLGIASLSKSQVSRLAGALDEQVKVFRARRLDAEYPYLFLDARYEHVREGGRVQSQAVVVAYGIRGDGVREVLAFDVLASEGLEVWREFLQGLVARGVREVRLVTSDAHQGLKRAIAEVLLGASWQRCRVHFLRNVLGQVPKSAQPMVGATVRTIFEQESRARAQTQLRQVCTTLDARFPKVVALLTAAEEEVLTFYDFPREHWRQIYSTNPLERLNKELKRRSAVVGIFPNRDSVIRLFGAMLSEQNDEWIVGRRYFSEQSMKKISADTPQETSQLQPAS
jgi:putative transposase